MYSKSIDSYFSAHDDDHYVKTVGKLAIVQAILEAERACDLWVDPTRASSKFRQYDKIIGSWLNDFLFLLTSGVAKSKYSFIWVFDQLVIVNFNYDRCVEQFLWCALRELFQISEFYAAELVRTKLKMLRPYGKVGDHPMGGRGIPFGATLHPVQHEELANGIRTFNEQVEDEELIRSVHEEIEKCDRAIFLGFHFHKQNTDLLTPSLSRSQPLTECRAGATGLLRNVQRRM